jgi:hypothetical protein
MAMSGCYTSPGMATLDFAWDDHPNPIYRLQPHRPAISLYSFGFVALLGDQKNNPLINGSSSFSYEYNSNGYPRVVRSLTPLNRYKSFYFYK